MTKVLRSRRVLTTDGIRAAAIHMADGRITRIAAWDDIPDGVQITDAGEFLVMPGIVDTHVHVNEPGRTDWEGFESATLAAAAGGITTLLDMPLNAIPATTTVAALETKRRAAENQCAVNVEFIGGVVPGNAGELEGLCDAGVRAFKCFLSPSGVDEFSNVSEADLRIAMPVLARLGLPLMVHAEDPACLIEGYGTASRVYGNYLASRPVEAEHSAIALMVRLVEEFGAPVHIVHLSSATSLGILRAARERWLPITSETCPHYLTFSAQEIPDGATEYKCAPPIRDDSEREGLWNGLIDGDIDFIASDHSPCPPAMKESHGDFFAAWGGIASLQISLPAVWSGARSRGVVVERVSNWMSTVPARLAGFARSKGKLAAGYDADITVWDPEASFTVDPSALRHRHALTPYSGLTLYGKVLVTYVAGECVFGDAESFH